MGNFLTDGLDDLLGDFADRIENTVDFSSFDFTDLGNLVTGDILGVTGEGLSYLDDTLRFSENAQWFADTAMSSVTDANYQLLLYGGVEALMADMALKSPIGQMLQNAAGVNLNDWSDDVIKELNPENAAKNLQNAVISGTDFVQERVQDALDSLNDAVKSVADTATDIASDAMGAVNESLLNLTDGAFSRFKGPLTVAFASLVGLGGLYIVIRYKQSPGNLAKTGASGSNVRNIKQVSLQDLNKFKKEDGFKTAIIKRAA